MCGILNKKNRLIIVMANIYNNINKTAFWVCLISSITLISISFVLPPLAVIDGSVLAAVGELFAFATLATIIEGIKKGGDITMTKGDTSLTFHTDDDEESRC